MKKEITKWVSSIEEISMKEAVNEFFDGDWDPRSWDYTEADIDHYLENFDEISDEEESLLRAEIKKEFDKRSNEIRQEEIDQLKDRDSILEWLESITVGDTLSKEEILDLILKNGNK